MFYASDRAVTGMAPVYAQSDGKYSLDPPEASATPAFYAYASADGGAIRTQPVYRWRRDGREALDPRARDGWSRGDIAFYVPCPRLTADNSGCAD